MARGLSAEQAQEIKALKIDHLTLRPNYRRHYPGGSLGALSLGFVNTEGKGQVGIEQALQGRLNGKEGKQIYLADARGSYSTMPDVITEPEAGQRVMLTIIPAIQQALDEAVAEAADFHNPKGIAAVMVRPAPVKLLPYRPGRCLIPTYMARVPSSITTIRSLAWSMKVVQLLSH